MNNLDIFKDISNSKILNSDICYLYLKNKWIKSYYFLVRNEFKCNLGGYLYFLNIKYKIIRIIKIDPFDLNHFDLLIADFEGVERVLDQRNDYDDSTLAEVPGETEA